MGFIHKREGGVDKESFSVSVLHPEGGNIVFNCVMDNIIEEKDQYKVIG